MSAPKRRASKPSASIHFDGRRGETSALDYVLPFEQFLAELNDTEFDPRIAPAAAA